MKFAEHLSAHITPEWRKQYIQYEAFKEMLYAAQDQAPSIEVALRAPPTSSLHVLSARAGGRSLAGVCPLGLCEPGGVAVSTAVFHGPTLSVIAEPAKDGAKALP
ncbi:hypothetical protein P4O66_022727 [Electrophorus voltai]|uniref:SPX domain-containing protein n=1 Tax=Electrophorus voltai TaxID=2609070 RepID=A0AAD8ZL66_9TELE|nr:hypothetical protein P4O66_022727 [Electrophorus voltai]